MTQFRRKWILQDLAVWFLQATINLTTILVMPLWHLFIRSYVSFHRPKRIFAIGYRQEVAAGRRFRFGRNWVRFLDRVNEVRIATASDALTEALGDIGGKSFLDVGSGSGLSSMAAYRLGAVIHAFDYDPQSVYCALALQKRHNAIWPVDTGSVLDRSFLSTLGQYDIVYSWGVLHHTGRMWDALGNMPMLVKPGGLLMVALYNDQQWKSRAWHFVKAAYNKNVIVRWLLVSTYAPVVTASRYIVRAATGRLNSERGMSLWYDAIDWLGGFPFEVTNPSSVVAFFEARGFTVVHTQFVGKRSGCNEFVFKRRD